MKPLFRLHKFLCCITLDTNLTYSPAQKRGIFKEIMSSSITPRKSWEWKAAHGSTGLHVVKQSIQTAQSIGKLLIWLCPGNFRNFQSKQNTFQDLTTDVHTGWWHIHRDPHHSYFLRLYLRTVKFSFSLGMFCCSLISLCQDTSGTLQVINTELSWAPSISHRDRP